MKGIVFITLFIFGVLSTYAQNKGRNEVYKINRSILTARYNASLDGGISFYYDEDGLLRKFVNWSDYPESSSVHIGYYNADGQLIYILFNNQQPEGYSYKGSAHVNDDDSAINNITFDYKLQEEGINFINHHIQGQSSSFPDLIGDWPLSKFTCTDSLKVLFDIENIQNHFSSKKVSFPHPELKDETFINTNNVRISKEPSTDSETILVLDAGERVKVIRVLSETTVDDSSKFPWYKIEFRNTIGYVFGAFLEPVERSHR